MSPWVLVILFHAYVYGADSPAVIPQASLDLCERNAAWIKTKQQAATAYCISTGAKP